MDGPGVPHADSVPNRDCSLPAHFTNDELAALMRRPVEKKWQFALTRDLRLFIRSGPDEWLEYPDRSVETGV